MSDMTLTQAYVALETVERLGDFNTARRLCNYIQTLEDQADKDEA